MGQENIAISLGWDCAPASHAVDIKLRKTKAEGYKTCPFDLMITNYNGIVECLRDDFKYLYDPEYIKLATVKRTCNYLDLKKNDEIIINTKYNFIFNHESPNHGNLYLHENWPNGTYHFCINNFQYFIERYKRRARHFKKYLKSGNKIIFILSKINNNLETCDELKNVINEKYPNLDFDFIFMEETRHDIFNEYLTFDFV
jgi:hypothetical protein